MNFRFHLVIFCLLGSIQSFAQRQIKVSYNYDNVTEKYIFEAQNTSNNHYTLVIYFNTINNLRASTGLPVIKTIGPGINRLFTLERSGPGSTNFDWGWVYWLGTHKAKVDDVDYVLPVTPGKKVEVVSLSSLKQTLYQEEDSTHYALGFNMVDGDTIRAVRRGVVESIQQDIQTDTLTYSFTRNRNSMRIRHEDGTVARYTNFKNNSALIEEGDEVLPGTPLALATQTNIVGDAYVLLTITYIEIEPERNVEYKEWATTKYVIPKFKTDGYQGELEPRKSYLAILNEDLITQEMSKREKKKYLSGN